MSCSPLCKDSALKVFCLNHHSKASYLHRYSNCLFSHGLESWALVMGYSPWGRKSVGHNLAAKTTTTVWACREDSISMGTLWTTMSHIGTWRVSSSSVGAFSSEAGRSQVQHSDLLHQQEFFTSEPPGKPRLSLIPVFYQHCRGLPFDGLEIVEQLQPGQTSKPLCSPVD